MALPANTGNLVKYLEKSFTNKTTFLTEMMQNARRAKATYVAFNLDEENNKLVVTDDGVGITEKSLLFTIAESGWGNMEETADVVKNEDPFGVGFLSVLFACKTILVESPGFSLFGETSRILGENVFHREDSSDVGAGTRIELRGLKADKSTFLKVVKEASRGFPIEVLFDGVPMERPYALDIGKFEECPMGQWWWREKDYSRYPQVGYFIQGLPVGVNTYSATSHPQIVVHLDCKQYSARVPDRAVLNDAEAAAKAVLSFYEQQVKELFIRMLENSPLELLRHRDTLYRHGLLHLLNTVQALPKDLLCSVQDLPYMTEDSCDRDWLVTKKESFTREDIASGRVKVFHFSDDYEMDGRQDTAARLAWIRQAHDTDSSCDYLVYDGGLDSGHWLYDYLLDEDRMEMSVLVGSQTFKGKYRGDTLGTYDLVICKSYTLRMEYDWEDDPRKEGFLMDVRIDDEPLFLASEGNLYTPGRTHRQDLYSLIRQMDKFYSQGDQPFDDDLVSKELTKLSQYISLNSMQDPAQALLSLIGGLDLSLYPGLFGKEFKVGLSGEGRPVVSVLNT